MDMMYANFCLADPVFYDSPSRVRVDASDLAGNLMAGRTVPDGWVLHESEGWTHLTPTSASLPVQGWKVHLSATLGNAVAVLDAVWNYCVPRMISFKFLPDRVTLFVRYSFEALAELRAVVPDNGKAEIRPRGAVDSLADALDAGEVDWATLRASLQRSSLASATPDRDDRLFPGEVHQFIHNGIGFAYGAAGILHVLAATDAGRYPDHENWLLNSVRKGMYNDAVGFFDDLHGIAYTLENLGCCEDDLAVLEAVPNASLDAVSANLFDGLAGIGLTLSGIRRVAAPEFIIGSGKFDNYCYEDGLRVEA